MLRVLNRLFIGAPIRQSAGLLAEVHSEGSDAADSGSGKNAGPDIPQENPCLEGSVPRPVPAEVRNVVGDVPVVGGVEARDPTDFSVASGNVLDVHSGSSQAFAFRTLGGVMGNDPTAALGPSASNAAPLGRPHDLDVRS